MFQTTPNMKTALIAFLHTGTASVALAASSLPLAPGPFQPRWIRSPTTIVPIGSATPNSASGRTGGRKRSPWTAIGMPPSLCAEPPTIQTSPGELRSPLDQRLQRHHSLVEGREVGPRPADDPLQASRRESTSSAWRRTTTISNLWNSKLHRWNAVQMGPKRDVVGDWQKAARKHGLKIRRLRAPRRQLHLVSG